jgi:Na+-transporting methylmalonyl-CoA/oxaloacetate decarboxylase gamma subunit
MDWGEALRIFGIGFGGVFAILIILALAVYLTGIIIQRRAAQKESKAEEKPKAPPKK